MDSSRSVGQTAVVVVATLVLTSVLAGTVVAGDATNAEPTAEGTTVSVTDSTVAPGENATVDVVLDATPNGLRKYNLTVSLADGTVANVDGATGQAIGGNQFAVRSQTSDSITFRAADLSNSVQAGSDEVTLATVTLDNTSLGSTDIDVTVHEMTDEQDQQMNPTSEAGTLTVAADGETTVDVVLDGAPSGLQRYNVSLTGNGAPITAVESGIIGGASFEVVDGGVGSPHVSARGADLGGQVGSFSGEKTLYTATFAGNLSASDLSVQTTALTDDNSDPMADSRVRLRVQSDSLFEKPIPGTGASGPPTDTDGDGKYDDVNGDGRATFADAIALAFIDSSTLSARQTAALDFDGDGTLDFADAISLAFSV
ncbi:MAG: hypothetical protein ACQETI_03450 [Halobacteriota archaeon]